MNEEERGPVKLHYCTTVTVLSIMLVYSFPWDNDDFYKCILTSSKHTTLWRVNIKLSLISYALYVVTQNAIYPIFVNFNM